MRFRLIGALAALLMLAPVAGFARTTAVAQPAVTVQTMKKNTKKSKKNSKTSK